MATIETHNVAPQFSIHGLTLEQAQRIAAILGHSSNSGVYNVFDDLCSAIESTNNSAYAYTVDDNRVVLA